MIPYIMVEPEKWSEMVKGMEENACLKAENEELHKDYEALADEHTKLIDKNKTLKAEVERLKSNLLGRDATIMGLDSTIKCREAEVERLRKANISLYMEFEEFGQVSNSSIYALRDAAKEGKPSETKSPSFIEELGNGVEKHDLLFRYPAKEGKPSA